MTTVLISKENDKVMIIPILCHDNDGFNYKVVETKRIFKSEKGAIKNARKLLKKKRGIHVKRTRTVLVKIKRRRTK